MLTKFMISYYCYRIFYTLNHGGNIMNTEKFIVRLSNKVNRAFALLHADANGPDWTNEQIASRTGLTLRAITNIRKQLVTEGFEGTLNRKQ